MLRNVSTHLFHLAYLFIQRDTNTQAQGDNDISNAVKLLNYVPTYTVKTYFIKKVH